MTDGEIRVTDYMKLLAGEPSLRVDKALEIATEKGYYDETVKQLFIKVLEQASVNNRVTDMYAIYNRLFKRLGFSRARRTDYYCLSQKLTGSIGTPGFTAAIAGHKSMVDLTSQIVDLLEQIETIEDWDYGALYVSKKYHTKQTSPVFLGKESDYDLYKLNGYYARVGIAGVKDSNWQVMQALSEGVTGKGIEYYYAGKNVLITTL